MIQILRITKKEWKEKNPITAEQMEWFFRDTYCHIFDNIWLMWNEKLKRSYICFQKGFGVLLFFVSELVLDKEIVQKINDRLNPDIENSGTELVIAG